MGVGSQEGILIVRNVHGISFWQSHVRIIFVVSIQNLGTQHIDGENGKVVHVDLVERDILPRISVKIPKRTDAEKRIVVAKVGD